MRTSLLAAIVGAHAFQGTRWTVAGEVSRPLGNQHPTIVPCGVFATRDSTIQIAVGNDHQWRAVALTTASTSRTRASPPPATGSGTATS